MSLFFPFFSPFHPCFCKSYKIPVYPLCIYTHNSKNYRIPLTFRRFARIIKMYAFRQDSQMEEQNMRKYKKLFIFLAAALVLNIIMNFFGNRLAVEYYTMQSDTLAEPLRIVFVSDLHNCTYGGKENAGLWEKIQEQSPDIVLFGGDVIDMSGGTDKALHLMQTAAAQYPCAYSPGNHEFMRDDYEAFFADAELHLPVLMGNSCDIQANGQTIRICGVVDAVGYHRQLTQSCESLTGEEDFSLLLLHQPEQLETVTAESAGLEKHFDLVLSGHAHGGQWIVPGILPQGVYAPDQGIFPAFTNGQRESGDTTQIVSRGLAKPPRMLLFPRICNRPELSVIDIVPA